MIILDTNVISERLRERPDSGISLWLDSQPAEALYLCTPVLAELQFGAARLKPSERQRGLLNAISSLTSDAFEGRILSFDKDAALAYGLICARREALGRTIAPMDAMIAAIARSNNASLATRNVADFEQTGIDVLNPFVA